MGYYDLHIHTLHSIGENTLDEMIAIAKRLGYDGIGYCKFYEDEIHWDIERRDIDIVKVCIIKTENPDELRKMIRKVREKAEIIAVHGGSYEINRSACENSMVDILLHPELERNDSGLDHICIRSAAENNVAIEINFREILHAHGLKRAKLLKFMRKNISLCTKYGAPLIVCSGAQNRFEMRAPRDLAGLMFLLGVEISKAMECVSNVPEKIVQINREKLNGKRFGGVVVET